jgi:hypothetical protein
MAAIQHNARLNEFLIAIGRSLLQYADECWPWASAGEAEAQSALHRLAELQRREVGAIAELLDERDWTIDFGTYPTEYTDLHFISLDYFLGHIIAGEQALVVDLDEAVHSCADDIAAVKVLDEVLETERRILDRLQTLVVGRAQGAAV